MTLSMQPCLQMRLLSVVAVAQIAAAVFVQNFQWACFLKYGALSRDPEAVLVFFLSL